MKQVVKIENIAEFDLYDITVKDDHCFKLDNGIVAHNSMYPKTIVSGGTGVYLSADNIYILGRQQEKDGTDLVGHNFIINVEKSRHVREKSKIPITVKFEGGLSRWSGLLDIGLESSLIVKPSNGWYSRVDAETGEIETKKWRAKETNCAEFWLPVLSNKKFQDWVKENYQVSHSELVQDDSINAELAEMSEADDE